jgi:hypothetical protein
MILRNFLFLDTDALSNYLSTLEGYAEVEIDETVTKQRMAGGKVSIPIAEGTGGTENTTSIKRKLATTDEARFQRLYEILDGKNDVQYLDAFDIGIWQQLYRGEIIEVQAKMHLPTILRQLEEVESLSPLLNIASLFGQNPLDDPQASEAVQGMKAMNKMMEGKPLPLLFEATSTRGFHFFASLPRQHLRCQLSELQGEATVFGKIQRFIEKGKQETVFSLMPEFESLTNANRKQRRSMQKKLQQDFVEKLKGPAIVLSPTAIYL